MSIERQSNERKAKSAIILGAGLLAIYPVSQLVDSAAEKNAVKDLNGKRISESVIAEETSSTVKGFVDSYKSLLATKVLPEDTVEEISQKLADGLNTDNYFDEFAKSIGVPRSANTDARAVMRAANAARVAGMNPLAEGILWKMLRERQLKS